MAFNGANVTGFENSLFATVPEPALAPQLATAPMSLGLVGLRRIKPN